MLKLDAVSTHGSTGVGIAGFEPTASASQMLPSTKLTYIPIVEYARFELATPCLQGRCSPN